MPAIAELSPAPPLDPREAEPPLTLADLLEQFGPIPLRRIVFEPWPGTATEADLVARLESQDRLYELLDGTLLEKVVGQRESRLAVQILLALGTFVREHRLGQVFGPDGPFRLRGRDIRMPDIAFVSAERWRETSDPVADTVPDLAVEVISRGNTRKEMADKLALYFAAGVRLVWYVYPLSRSVEVFTSPTAVTVLGPADTLTGDPVLPGFALPLTSLFASVP